MKWNLLLLLMLLKWAWEELNLRPHAYQTSPTQRVRSEAAKATGLYAACIARSLAGFPPNSRHRRTPDVPVTHGFGRRVIGVRWEGTA